MDALFCYVEENASDIENVYTVQVREKLTNKIVIFVPPTDEETAIENGHHLLTFLSQIRENYELMPTIYDRYGDDIILVTGDIILISSEKIFVKDYGYLFETIA